MVSPDRSAPSLSGRAPISIGRVLHSSGTHIMAIKIVISNTVKFKVKGTIKDEAGVDQPFDFGLTCMRLDSDQIRNKLRDEGDASVTDFLVDVVEDWAGVKDADDKALTFTEENLRSLCRIPGVANLAFRTYLVEVGAKEKN